MLPGAFNYKFQILSQESAIRQVRERVVKSRVTKVVLALLQLDADSFLLRDMPAQLFHVTFGLLGAFALGLGARPFGFRAFAFGLLGLSGSGPDFVKVLLISEVNDQDDRRGDEQNVDP